MTLSFRLKTILGIALMSGYSLIVVAKLTNNIDEVLDHVLVTQPVTATDRIVEVHFQ